MEVAQALDSLNEEGLAGQVTSADSRVPKYAHRMQEVFNFPYTADVGKGLTEREYDHILFGWYDQLPHPNPKEVSDWRWISFTELKKELSDTPDSFTPWLRLMVDDVEKNYRKLKQ